MASKLGVAHQLREMIAGCSKIVKRGNTAAKANNRLYTTRAPSKKRANYHTVKKVTIGVRCTEMKDNLFRGSNNRFSISNFHIMPMRTLSQ